jgi:hypothetical protein
MTIRSRRPSLCLLLGLGVFFSASDALARQGEPAAPAPFASSGVSEPILAVAKGRSVSMICVSGCALQGTLVAYDAATVTFAEEGTGRLVAVARQDVSELRLRDAVGPIAAVSAATSRPDAVVSASTRPAKVRHVGVQVYAGPGNFMLDLEHGPFYGFVGTSIGYPLIFSGKFERSPDDYDSDDQYLAAVVGLGGSWKISARSNWRFDFTGTLTPTWWGGFSMGIGIAAGFHYTSPSGFTVGFKIPVFGVAPGCNEVFGDRDYDSATGASHGCPKVTEGAELVGNYYLQAGMSLPIVSLGYRF